MSSIFKLIGGLGQDRLTGEERLLDVVGERQGPWKMGVASIREGDKKSGVGDACHVPKPFLLLSAAGPSTLPARSRKG